MEEKKNEGSVLPISTILVTMAVIGGMWFYAMPLKGTRPVTDANVCCEEKVQARLWQDPFSAVSKYKKATNMTYRSVSTTKIPAKIAKIITDNGNVTVLGVMVFGGPYAEDAEGRLRKRYAIVSALSRLDYASEDPQHIEYFESELLESDDTYSGIEEKLYRYINKKQNQTLTVPFEWFTKENEYDKNMSSTVLLLWLNDDMFQLEPLQNLSHLIGKIKEKVGTEVEGKAKCLIENNLDFKILGPAGSTNLVAMIEEAGNITNKKGGSSEDFSSFQIYSPFATAHKSLLFSKALGHIDTGCSKYVADYINEGSGGKIKLIRTIASDRDLCDSLLKELKLRRVDPIENNGNHIALIAEWDTFYGRSLPKTFINFVVKSGSESHKKRLHRFSYLRGIDGQLPGQSQLKPDRLETGEETKAKKELMDTGFMHRPTGRNQYDYLLRLTRQIHQLKKELVKKGERLKAIGVLGSDIYDKLLILQAMRQHFPDMIFFTTDLDARLLHPDEFKWARSLIVASSFGLRLHEDIQYTIPAFRDNYQTSLFFSTILALKASDKVFIKGGISQQSSILQSLQPRMFEIGRRGAFDLTDNIQNNGKKISISLMKDGQKKEIKLEPSTLYPESDLIAGKECIESTKSKYLARVIVLFVLLMVLIYVSSDRVKKRISEFVVPKRTFNMKSLFVIFAAYFVGLFCIAYSICENFFIIEPFSLFDGVSIWPTEIIRLLSAILSICFLFYIWGQIKKTDKEIAKEYGLSKLGEVFINHPRIVQMFPYYWKICDSEDKKSAVCFGKLWNEYLSLGSFDKRVKRTAMYTIVFMFFGILLIKILTSLGDSLFVPARGEFSFCVDFVVLKCISVPSMLFMTFFVVDHHKLFRQLIKLSAEEEKVCLPEVGIKYREHAYQKTLMLANYTEQTKWLNLFPFIVLFLMIVARSSYFDNWNMSVGLLILFVTLGIYSFANTIILHKEINRCKEGMVAKLKKEIICLHSKSLKVHAGIYEKVDFEMEQIKSTVRAIESIREGAFRPLIQQPLFQAALLPFGGAGSLWIMNGFT